MRLSLSRRIIKRATSSARLSLFLILLLRHSHQPHNYSSVASTAAMHLIFDFDGTITQKDTIGELARVGIEFQRKRHGHHLQATWDQVVREYLDDYQAHKDGYEPSESVRDSLEHEFRFLSGSKKVEEASLARVDKSGVFRGLTTEDLAQAGVDAVKEGRVKLRDGFEELLELAESRGWTAGVISVNWSRSFIQGALLPHKLDIIANEISTHGEIYGPEILGRKITNGGEKRRALRSLVPDANEKVLYFGDSTTDMECLVEGGVVISDHDDSSLLRTLRRVGVSVPHVSGRDKDDRVAWARNFREVMQSTVLDG